MPSLGFALVTSAVEEPQLKRQSSIAQTHGPFRSRCRVLCAPWASHHAVACLGDALDEACNGLGGVAFREHERAVIGLDRRCATDWLVHHQITTTILNSHLKTFNRFEDFDQLFACLAAGEIHAATSQAVGDFVPRGIATFCGQVRCVP